jgi:hypothetical protein
MLFNIDNADMPESSDHNVLIALDADDAALLARLTKHTKLLGTSSGQWTTWSDGIANGAWR